VRFGFGIDPFAPGFVPASAKLLLTKQRLTPGGIGSGERRVKFGMVMEAMIAAAFVTLVNQRLEFQHDIGIGRAQRNPHCWQAIAQANAIGRPDFTIPVYPGYLKAKDKDELAPGLRVPTNTPPVFLVRPRRPKKVGDLEKEQAWS
jgi:hypothetical protein